MLGVVRYSFRALISRSMESMVDFEEAWVGAKPNSPASTAPNIEPPIQVGRGSRNCWVDVEYVRLGKRGGRHISFAAFRSVLGISQPGSPSRQVEESTVPSNQALYIE